MEQPVLPPREVPAQPTLLWDAYELLGIQLFVGCEAESHQAAIRAVLAGFGPVPAPSSERQLRFTLNGEPGGWRLDGPTGVLYPAAEFAIALSRLEWHVIDAALSRRADLFQLHAGALCLPTRRAGLVIAGKSGCGKSTLTLAMMLRGFAPFSDDVTVLDPQRLELQVFPRAFHVEPWTWDVLAPISGGPLRADPEMPQGHFSPPQWAHRPVPVRWVVFPDYESGQSPALAALRPSEAVALLIEHSGSVHRDSRAALKTAARIAETIPCYRMAVGDIVESCALLQRLVYE